MAQLQTNQSTLTRFLGFKTFFKLNSTEHEIYHARKCLNAKLFLSNLVL